MSNNQTDIHQTWCFHGAFKFAYDSCKGCVKMKEMEAEKCHLRVMLQKNLYTNLKTSDSTLTKPVETARSTHWKREISQNPSSHNVSTISVRMITVQALPNTRQFSSIHPHKQTVLCRYEGAGNGERFVESFSRKSAIEKENHRAE